MAVSRGPRGVGPGWKPVDEGSGYRTRRMDRPKVEPLESGSPTVEEKSIADTIRKGERLKSRSSAAPNPAFDEIMGGLLQQVEPKPQKLGKAPAEPKARKGKTLNIGWRRWGSGA